MSGSTASAPDHKALLLAARQRQRAFAQAVLDLVPQHGAAQRRLDDVADVPVEPEVAPGGVLRGRVR
jgi:hypothetical protein